MFRMDFDPEHIKIMELMDEWACHEIMIFLN